MKKLKLWTILFISMLTILCICIGVEGFGKETSYKSKTMPKRIVLIGHIDNNPYWQVVKKGAEEAAVKRGCTLEYMAAKDGSLEDGIRQLDKAIASKADGIITYVQEEDQFAPYINKGIEKEIPIVTIDADAKSSKRIAFIGSNNVAAGEAAAKELVKVAENNGIIGIIVGSNSATNQKERVKGFEDYIKENSKLKVEAVESSDFSLLQAEIVTKKILKEKPYIDYLYCTSSLDGVGAAKAVKELDLANKVKIVCFDDMTDTLQYVREGIILTTVIQSPYEMGCESLNVMMDKVEGKPIQTHHDIAFKVVNKFNVDKYNIK